MRIIGRDEIAQVLNLEDALGDIERSFRLFSTGSLTAPPVAHLGFSDPPGDCHIKSAHIHGEPIFAVKVSNGFYQNPSRGLPSSNGLVMVFCADTGAPLALLEDQGLITDVRTALAGVVATSLGRPDGAGVVGVIGTGIQAHLQLEYLDKLKGPLEARVWGRTAAAVDGYVKDLRSKGVPVEGCDTVQVLCEESDTIITATPSTTPLVESRWLKSGTHITAVGADAPGKRELEPQVFARARGVLVDSMEQCIHHGEVCEAVRSGILKPETLVEIGQALDGMSWELNPEGDLTIADLSGLGASDAMMAQAVWEAVNRA